MAGRLVSVQLATKIINLLKMPFLNPFFSAFSLNQLEFLASFCFGVVPFNSPSLN